MEIIGKQIDIEEAELKFETLLTATENVELIEAYTAMKKAIMELAVMYGPNSVEVIAKDKIEIPKEELFPGAIEILKAWNKRQLTIEEGVSKEMTQLILMGYVTKSSGYIIGAPATYALTNKGVEAAIKYSK